MKKNAYFLYASLMGTMLISSFNSNSQPPDWEWAKNAGGSGYDRGAAITCSSSENLLVSGYFQGTATFDTTVLTSSVFSDAFIAKYTPSGALIWVKSVASSSSYPEPSAIYEDDSGNIYLVGTFGVYSSSGGGGDITFDDATTFISWGNQDVFIAKYDSAGNFEWARHVGSVESDKPVSTLDNSEHLIFSGILWNTVYFDSAIDTLVPYHLFDIYLAGYDSEGSLLFYRNAASCTEVIEPQDVTTDIDGNIYLAGKYNGKPTFGLPVDSINLAADVFYSQGFLAKYDPVIGDNKWAYTAGDTMNYDYPSTINYKGSSKLVMCGTYLYNASFGTLPDTINLIAPSSAGYGELYLVQYDTNGTADWAINAGHASAGSLTVRDAFYQDGQLFLSGDYSAGPALIGQGPEAVTITPLHAIFVADYNDTGHLNWVNHAGGLYYEGAESLTADALNNVYISGFYLDECAFPGTPIELSTFGFEDIMVARLDDISLAVDENDFVQDQFIYPNPASQEVTINTGQEKNCHVQLLDISGRVLFQQMNASIHIRIDISNYPNGIYFILISDNEGRKMKYKLFKI